MLIDDDDDDDDDDDVVVGKHELDELMQYLDNDHHHDHASNNNLLQPTASPLSSSSSLSNHHYPHHHHQQQPYEEQQVKGGEQQGQEGQLVKHVKAHAKDNGAATSADQSQDKRNDKNIKKIGTTGTWRDARMTLGSDVDKPDDHPDVQHYFNHSEFLQGWKRVKVPPLQNQSVSSSSSSSSLRYHFDFRDILDGKYPIEDDDDDNGNNGKEENHDTAGITHIVGMQLVAEEEEEYGRKGEKYIGTINIALYGIIVPRTVENFLQLSLGATKHRVFDTEMTYEGSYFHRIVPGQLLQAGDIDLLDGKGGESIYGKHFKDENFKLNHDKRGVIAMANRGIPDTNGSQFYITLRRSMPSLNGKSVVFGRVLNEEILDKLSSFGTSQGRPKRKIRIKDCSLLWNWRDHVNADFSSLFNHENGSPLPLVNSEGPYPEVD